MLPPSKPNTLQSLLSASATPLNQSEKLIDSPLITQSHGADVVLISTVLKLLYVGWYYCSFFKASLPELSLSFTLFAFSLCDGEAESGHCVGQWSSLLIRIVATGKQLSLKKNEEAQWPCAHVPGVSGVW